MHLGRVRKRQWLPFYLVDACGSWQNAKLLQRNEWRGGATSMENVSGTSRIRDKHLHGNRQLRYCMNKISSSLVRISLVRKYWTFSITSIISG